MPPCCRAMWVVLALLLALSSGALSLDKLNMCMDAKHHKVEPGPESQLYQQVMNANAPQTSKIKQINWWDTIGDSQWFKVSDTDWNKNVCFPLPLPSVLRGMTMHVARPTLAQKPMTITPTYTTSTGITVVPWAPGARNISSRTLASMSARHTWDPGYKKCVLYICSLGLPCMCVPTTLDGSIRGWKGLASCHYIMSL